MTPNKRRNAAQFYAERLMGVADDRGPEHMYPSAGRSAPAPSRARAASSEIDAQQPTPAQWRAYQQQLAQQRMMESYREPPPPTYADPQPAPPGEYREPVRQMFTHVPFPYPDTQPAYVAGDWRSQMEESISRTREGEGPYVYNDITRMMYPQIVGRVVQSLPPSELRKVSPMEWMVNRPTHTGRTERELARIPEREERAAFMRRVTPQPGDRSIGSQFPRPPSPVPFEQTQPPDMPPVPYAPVPGEQYVPADWWSMLQNDMRGRPEVDAPIRTSVSWRGMGGGVR